MEEAVYQAASILVQTLAFLLGGVAVFFLWRFITSKFHVHQWRTVVNLGFKSGGWEAERVCKCKARKKVQYWPPPEQEIIGEEIADS